MLDSPEQPRSDNPNAPRIPQDLYFREKAGFAGYLIGSILYGTLEAPLTDASIHPCSLGLFGLF